MSTENANRIIHLQDSYSLLYSFIGESLCAASGFDGEAALREGLRTYGQDRGLATRKKHLDAGIKINMQSLFSIGFDLPGDPRFQRKQLRLNPEERVSYTLVCPMADAWNQAGSNRIGRIYCEEFHYACYNSYAFGYTKVNLATTLSHLEDDHCSFTIILRPEDLPEDLKPICFESYDPFYQQPSKELEPADENGFSVLSIKIFCHLLAAAESKLGNIGVEAVGRGLKNAAHEAVARLQKELPDLTEKTFWHHYPIRDDSFCDELWGKMKNGSQAKQVFFANFLPVFS